MSYNEDKTKRNYRGRGKKAAQHYNPHFHERDEADTSMMRPISRDAVAQAGGRIVAEGMTEEEAEHLSADDPFAPQTSTEEFARVLADKEAGIVGSGVGQLSYEFKAPDKKPAPADATGAEVIASIATAGTREDVQEEGIEREEQAAHDTGAEQAEGAADGAEDRAVDTSDAMPRKTVDGSEGAQAQPVGGYAALQANGDGAVAAEVAEAVEPAMPVEPSEPAESLGSSLETVFSIDDQNQEQSPESALEEEVSALFADIRSGSSDDDAQPAVPAHDPLESSLIPRVDGTQEGEAASRQGASSDVPDAAATVAAFTAAAGAAANPNADSGDVAAAQDAVSAPASAAGYDAQGAEASSRASDHATSAEQAQAAAGQSADSAPSPASQTGDFAAELSARIAAVGEIDAREEAQGETPAEGATTALDAEAEHYSRDDAHYEHRGRFSRTQRIALIVIAVVAVLLFGVGGAVFAIWQNAQSNIELKDSSVGDKLTPIAAHGDPYWVLILGSDSRSKALTSEQDQKSSAASSSSSSSDSSANASDSSASSSSSNSSVQGNGGDSRSDVIMLARVDEVHKQVTLVSIPRDTKVTMRGYGTQKINAAYALGGASLAIDTVADFAGVNISHYVEVYFNGFSTLADAIGGVDVDVPEYVSYGGVTLQPGPQHLNGKQALTFARNRKTYATGDFRRTECQRILVQAIAEKVANEDLISLPGTVDAVTQCFSTDLSLSELIGLASAMRGANSDSFYSTMSPSDGGLVDGVWYTFTLVNQWKLIMQRAKQGEDPGLDDREKAICGTASTQTVELDMSQGLPPEIQQQLADYEEEKAEKAAAKKSKSDKKSKKSSGSDKGEAADAETENTNADADTDN